MADWIKVEHCTPNKPEVLQLSRFLGVSRDDAFGKAMRFWIWLDSISVDGHVDGVTSFDGDAVVGVDGFCAAMMRAGWLVCDDQNAQFIVPNFDRHNGVSAKSRALKTRRQAGWRGRKTVDAPVDGSASTREEKRREYKKTPISPFAAPSVSDVQAYSDEASLHLDAQKFVDFYQSKGWKVGRNPMKDWQAAARNASRDGWCRVGSGGNGEMSADEYKADLARRAKRTRDYVTGGDHA